jgi:predicted Zn-ribbon and HTH transcriptional regulator
MKNFTEQIDGYISRVSLNGKTYALRCEVVEARPITCKKCGASFQLRYGEGQCPFCQTYYTTHFYIEERE